MNLSNINVNNSQIIGVDDVPFPGSDNLIKSNVVDQTCSGLLQGIKLNRVSGIQMSDYLNTLSWANTTVYYQDFGIKKIDVIEVGVYNEDDVKIYIVTANNFGDIPSSIKHIATIKRSSEKTIKYILLNKTLGDNEYLGISGHFSYGRVDGYEFCQASAGEVTKDYSLGLSVMNIEDGTAGLELIKTFDKSSISLSLKNKDYNNTYTILSNITIEQASYNNPGLLSNNDKYFIDSIQDCVSSQSFGLLNNTHSNSSTVDIYVNLYNRKAPTYCRVTKIQFVKNTQYPYAPFEVYACSISVDYTADDKNNTTITPLRKCISITPTDSDGSIVSRDVDIILESGEYLGFTGNLTYTGNGELENYYMLQTGRNNPGYAINVKYTYDAFGIFKYESVIENLSEEVTQIQEEISKTENKDKYVCLYSNDLTSNFEITKTGTWTFDANGATPSAIGNTTWMRLNKNYWSDQRYLQFYVDMKSDTILMITCTHSSVNDGEGASRFSIDFNNGLLKIFSVGAGDDQATASGYTNTVLESENISNMVNNHTYRVRLYKTSTLHKLEITDTLTGISASVSHNGWAAGRQNQRYGFYIESGGLATIKNLKIYTLNRPDVVFTGDSITEGVMVLDRTKRYSELYRTNHPHLNVVISAMGGRQLSEVLTMFDNEWSICKPKILSCLIGANGGNTDYDFMLLKEKCDSIGCQLIVHYRTCQQSGDSHIGGNEQIALLPFKGARFDIATAKDNYPLVDSSHTSPRYNSSLYYDSGLHPNVDGNLQMYNRLLLDCEILNII